MSSFPPVEQLLRHELHADDHVGFSVTQEREVVANGRATDEGVRGLFDELVDEAHRWAMAQ
jgi:hypothetical protein